MADSIFNCRRIDAGGANDSYLIYYALQDGGETTHREIEVLASDMVDPEDQNEAKALANPKASSAKAAWVLSRTVADSDTASSSLNGDVTL